MHIPPGAQKFRSPLCIPFTFVSLIALFGVEGAKAETTVAISYSGTTAVQARADFSGTIGSLIRANAGNMVVTHLGVMDADAASDAQDPDGADGLTGFADDDGYFAGPISVGLWDSAGVLLASGTVSSSDPYSGGYRYVELTTPVPLTLDQTYLLGARVGGGIEWFLDGGTTSQFDGVSPYFSLVENRFSGAGGLDAPMSNGGGVLGRWAAANALVTVPEPTTGLLMLGGLGLTGLVRRRQR